MDPIEHFQTRIKLWQAPLDGDPEYHKQYAQDRKDMRHVLSLCKKGKFKEASEAASGLDTILRDEINDQLWNFLKDFD